MRIQIKIYLILFLFNNSAFKARCLDFNENSDEIEIFKHIFAKLNKIIEVTDLIEHDLGGIKRRTEHMEEKVEQKSVISQASDRQEKDNLLSCYNKDMYSSENPDEYCFGNNWIIIQRRADGSENFYRDWNDYKYGFGNKSNEFFMGLEHIHRLTAEKPHELLVVMEDFDNSKHYAKYDLFEIGTEEQHYVLKNLGTYKGNAGDSLTYHMGSEFSTRGRDNDQHPDFNCAEKFQSGWWFKSCHESNLNGCYSDTNSRDSKRSVACGIQWKTFRGQWYSLKFVEIMIRSKI